MASARAAAGLGPSSASDVNTTGCPGGHSLCPIPVPTVAITLALMGSRPGGHGRVLGGNNRKMTVARHSPVQQCPGWWELAEEGGREAQGATAVALCW